jgi:hypothetical protein
MVINLEIYSQRLGLISEKRQYWNEVLEEKIFNEETIQGLEKYLCN